MPSERCSSSELMPFFALAISQIAQSVGARMFADIAHIAGPIVAGLHPSPVPVADYVTSTTHKTLRGPRGGLILCKEEHAKEIDRRLFPGVQGGPLVHIIAAKAVAFGEALRDDFKEYQRQVLANPVSPPMRRAPTTFRGVGPTGT